MEYITNSGSYMYHFTDVIISFVTAFVLVNIITTVYRWTHQGLSYSRSFVQAMVLGAIAADLMIMVIGNNMARGLGILGALAIIRFRTPVRDPRDMTFLFCSLGIGIACGGQSYSVAIVGAIFFGLAALYLHIDPFANKNSFEGLVRFMLPADSSDKDKLHGIFSKHTSKATLISVRESVQGQLLEYSYQTTLLKNSSQNGMMEELRQLEGVVDPSVLMQRSTVEI